MIRAKPESYLRSKDGCKCSQYFSFTHDFHRESLIVNITSMKNALRISHY